MTQIVIRRMKLYWIFIVLNFFSIVVLIFLVTISDKIHDFPKEVLEKRHEPSVRSTEKSIMKAFRRIKLTKRSRFRFIPKLMTSVKTGINQSTLNPTTLEPKQFEMTVDTNTHSTTKSTTMELDITNVKYVIRTFSTTVVPTSIEVKSNISIQETSNFTPTTFKRYFENFYPTPKTFVSFIFQKNGIGSYFNIISENTKKL